MVDAEKQIKTNGEFLETLLNTEASQKIEARSFLPDFSHFKDWKSCRATGESIETVAEIFAARILPSIRLLKGNKADHKRIIGNVRLFLNEIAKVAEDFGVEVNLAEANNNLDQA
jgi:hypothetical protein